MNSAKALRQYAINQLCGMLNDIDTDLAFNGDMFDGFQVPLSDALQVLQLLQGWLAKGHHLYLIPGNHDLSSDSSRLSTFEFVSKVLLGASEQVTYHQGAGWLREGVYAISHVPNQDLFDLELSRVPECDYLLLHCNYDNGFAKEQDHSLNLSSEAIAKLPAKKIIMGHEHQAGTHNNGKVVIAGNQFPMSVSDCLGKSHKYRLVLSDDGVEVVKSWDKSNYVEVDWKEAATANAQFIRVVGSADETEAVAAVDAVAKLRRISDAFIVGSAVRIGSGEELDMAEALASVEDVRAFDVMAMLKELLKPEQVAVLENLK